MNSRAFKLGNNACPHQSSGETENGRVVGTEGGKNRVAAEWIKAFVKEESQ